MVAGLLNGAEPLDYNSKQPRVLEVWTAFLTRLPGLDRTSNFFLFSKMPAAIIFHCLLSFPHHLSHGENDIHDRHRRTKGDIVCDRVPPVFTWLFAASAWSNKGWASFKGPAPTMWLPSRPPIPLFCCFLFSIREAVLRSTREGGKEQVVSAQNDAQSTRL